MEALPISFEIEIALGKDASAEEIDLSTRDLRDQVLRAGAERAEPVETAGGLPLGAKGSVSAFAGELAIAVLPTLLPKLVDLIVKWKRASKQRSTTLRMHVDGKPVEIEIDDSLPSAEILQAVLDGIAGARLKAPPEKRRP